jgi:hypothetical protein
MGRNKTGVAHDGTHNAFGWKGEATLAIHHDPGLARRGDVGIAPPGMKPAVPKRLHPVSLHNSATPHQIAGVDAGGQSHAVAVVDGGVKLTSSAAAAPMANAYGGMIPKVRDAAPPKPGMRRQQGAIARSVKEGE